LHIAVAEPKFEIGGLRFPALHGLDADVNVFKSMAQSRSFVTVPNNASTKAAVCDAIVDVVGATRADDLLFLTLSGHGLQISDVSGDESADDGLDEAFACEDAYLLDDEIHELLTKLPPGARAVIVADCCHGETLMYAFPVSPPPVAPIVERRFEGMEATVLCLATCADSEEALFEIGSGSQTASVLLDVWSDGRYRGSYAHLWRSVHDRVTTATRHSTPRWTRSGPDQPTPIAHQEALSIAGAKATS
jgi:hypothetical protein